MSAFHTSWQEYDAAALRHYDGQTRLLFKFTANNGSSCHGGGGKWPLPTQHADGTWTPGKPRTVTDALVPCRTGLHLCEPRDLAYWIGPALWTVQVPEHVEEVRSCDKLVVRTARLERRVEAWTPRVMRQWALDCAERVILYTTDPRPAQAVRIARMFLSGVATKSAVRAACAAANAVAYAAANTVYVATPATTNAANAAFAARDAAAAATASAASYAVAFAGAAAANAASAVAYATMPVPPVTYSASAFRSANTAFAAERQWQSDRILHYLQGGQP